MRDSNIDFLRAIGLLLIILAHIGAPNGIQQARCFDVPLMIFVSGLSASGKKQSIPYHKYVLNRTKRLVYPTWLFLCFYILVLFGAQTLELIPTYITWNKVIESFLLLEGVGYVWIIRVFLLMMLITPILNMLCAKLESSWSFMLILIGIAIVQECICTILPEIQECSILYFITNEYLVYLIGYSILFMLGLRLRFYQNSKYNTMCVVAALLILLSASALIYIRFYGLPIYINSFKYPPQSYFLIYGASISIILWLIRPIYSSISKNRIFSFLGSNSIWIYLWHIPFTLVANKYIDNWILRYLFVLSSCLFIYTIQYNIINRKTLNNFSKYLIG